MWSHFRFPLGGRSTHKGYPYSGYAMVVGATFVVAVQWQIGQLERATTRVCPYGGYAMVVGATFLVDLQCLVRRLGGNHKGRPYDVCKGCRYDMI